MILTIIIFLIAITIASLMLLFRAWEIRTNRIEIDENKKNYTKELSFRYFEKIILFLAKHIIQWIVISSVKFWYTITTKIKFIVQNKLPKINKFLRRKNEGDSRKISFIQRAVIESKIKIKKVKEKIKKEHEEKEMEIEENSEVDKII